ncbi:protein TsetseEP-like [Gossypium hirsutum]|uniref:Protein TsetseEP-like n=1 Tax=Gossypium hirsutum TaxID=3635 RepID=A0ABM3BLE0_GOSHI|nr:protein TsetseEP-like [Gossypium hirsutum]
MVAGDGSWKLDLFRPWVLEKIINKIISIPPPHPLSGPNRIIWGATSTGSFSLKSSYEKDLSSFYSGSLLDWMKNNLQSHSSSWGDIDWPLTSSHKARSRLHNWPLHNDWVSLNTDGSVKFDEGFAEDSGCVRDHNGEWIIAFAKHLSNCTILEAELWGILNGLTLILDRHFGKILIQTDSIEANNVILEDSSKNSSSALVTSISPQPPSLVIEPKPQPPPVPKPKRQPVPEPKPQLPLNSPSEPKPQQPPVPEPKPQPQPPPVAKPDPPSEPKPQPPPIPKPNPQPQPPTVAKPNPPSEPKPQPPPVPKPNPPSEPKPQPLTVTKPNPPSEPKPQPSPVPKPNPPSKPKPQPPSEEPPTPTKPSPSSPKPPEKQQPNCPNPSDYCQVPEWAPYIVKYSTQCWCALENFRGCFREIWGAAFNNYMNVGKQCCEAFEEMDGNCHRLMFGRNKWFVYKLRQHCSQFY